MNIKAEEWNDLVREVARSTPIAGNNCQLSGTPDGVQVHYDPSGGVKHPWSVLPFYDPVEEVWKTYVEPGFVNGREPVIVMKNGLRGDIPPNARVLGNHYGKDKFNSKSPLIEVGLLDEIKPFLRLNNLHNAVEVSFEGGVPVSGAYPDFFRYLGARAPQSAEREFGGLLGSDDDLLNIIQGGEGAQLVTSVDEQHGDRSLFSTDVVMRVQKSASVVEVSDVPDLYHGQERLFYMLPPSGPGIHGLTIYNVSRFLPDPPPDPADAIAVGGFLNWPWDDLLLARIWFMSPGGVELPTTEDGGYIIDDSWQVFLEHKVFWNLLYASQHQIQNSQIGRLALPLPLGLGTATLLIDSLLGPINDAFDQLAAQGNRTGNEGSFWAI